MSDAVVEAITDLTRVMIAIHGDYKSKAEAIRALDALAIPKARIAAILAMPTSDVSSALAKDKKRNAKKGTSNGEV